MKKIVVLITFSFLIIACNTSEKEKVKSDKSEQLVMYKPSEMASLMEEMYVLNEKLKEKIIKNEDLGEFVEKFSNIHSAVLTDPNDRNSSFNAFSKVFIQNQKAIFSPAITNVKERFNTMVNSCVACHKTTCTGPIPKIKKLLIH